MYMMMMMMMMMLMTTFCLRTNQQHQCTHIKRVTPNFPIFLFKDFFNSYYNNYILKN